MFDDKTYHASYEHASDRIKKVVCVDE